MIKKAANRKAGLFIATTSVFLALLWWFDALVTSYQAQREKQELPLVLEPVLAPNEAVIDKRVSRTTPRQHDQSVISSSLQGTDIDGALSVGADGQLIVNLGVRDFFDYFLNTADEVGAEAAIAEVTRYIETYLPAEARLQALSLFENYLRYKRTEFELQQAPLTQERVSDADALVVLRENFNQMRSERSKLFTQDEQAALFGLEDIYAEHTLSSLEVLANEQISDDEKRSKLDELQRALPPELSGSLLETETGRQQQQSIEQLIASDQDDAQLHEQLLREGYVQEKADEIVSHRQQQRHFSTIYESYAQERAALSHESPDYEQKINALRARYFSTPEQQTRAKLLDLKKK